MLKQPIKPMVLYHMNSTKISKFGLQSTLIIIVLIFIGRFLFPFGDEPDWSVRAPQLLFGEHPIWSPYYLFSEWFNYLDINASRCQINAGALSLWATISASCSDGLIQIIIRWITTLIILSPMFLIIMFRRQFIKFANTFNLKLSDKEWNLRIDSLAISMILPGMIYYLGVLSLEQLHLSVALYIFLFWGFWLPILGFLAILFSIDFGNSMVVLAFVSLMILFTRIRRLNRTWFFLGLLSLISFAWIFDYHLLELLHLDFLPDILLSKSESIINSYNTSDLLTKYPVYLRPVITIMTSVFFTPSGIKVPLLYILFVFFTLILSLKALQSRNGNIEIFWFVPISIVLFFIFIFPTYVNAKYYIFMIPFFVYVALMYYSRKSIFILFSFSSFFVFLSLIMYRM
jgi:hypothetical protein